MTALLERLDNLSAPIVEQITKYLGVTNQNAKVGVGVLGAGLGAAALWKLFGSPRYNLPPGPMPLPLLGNLFNMGGNPKTFMQFHDIGKKYGEVSMIYMGPYRVILLNSADAIRQAYIKDDLAYADRQPFASLDVLTDNGKDIIGDQFGPELQQKRKLALAALRKYASGEALEHHVQFAFEAMSKQMDKENKFVPWNMGYLVSYNILASMCFGRQFEFDDPFMNKMMEIQFDLEKSLDSIFAFLLVMPIMKHFPTAIMRGIHKFHDVFYKFLNECIKEHMDKYNPDELTDFTYHLIHVFKETEEDSNTRNKNKLVKDHFKYILFDIFFAGTDTTRQTLAWIWNYLAAFPEVQAKAQKEIDDTIGDGPVTVSCREQLPYVDAVLHEVMRIMPVVPNGVGRRVRKDTKLYGYDVPKGTMVMNITWSAHYDEKLWPDPEAFLPERWLDENGQYVFQQNGFLPFSVGRRSCIGESFAKLELHMLTTLLLQRYTLKPAPGRRIDLTPMDGFIVRAPDQDIHVEIRKK